MKLRRQSVPIGLAVAALQMAPLVVHRACAETLPVPQVTAQDEQQEPVEIVTGPWGSKPGQFGKVDDASRPGPMDFALHGDTLYVLDPVNARVQLFGLDGGFRQEIPIGTRTADFMCVDEDGNVTVLDAFVRREVKTFSDSGGLVSQAGLPASLGLPSAVFADNGRLLIEERHNRVFELDVPQDERGQPARVAGSRNGRPAATGGHTLHAAKSGTHDVVIRADGRQTRHDPITLRFVRPVASIVALESDDRGWTYVATACQRDGGDKWKTDLILVGIDAEGGITPPIGLPNAYVTDHYRKLLVTGSGDVMQMQTTEDGVRFVRWTLPATQNGGESR